MVGLGTHLSGVYKRYDRNLTNVAFKRFNDGTKNQDIIYVTTKFMNFQTDGGFTKKNEKLTRSPGYPSDLKEETYGLLYVRGVF